MITPDISFAVVNHRVCVTTFIVVVASVFGVSIFSGLFRKKKITHLLQCCWGM